MYLVNIFNKIALLGKYIGTSNEVNQLIRPPVRCGFFRSSTSQVRILFLSSCFLINRQVIIGCAIFATRS